MVTSNLTDADPHNGLHILSQRLNLKLLKNKSLEISIIQKLPL